MRPSLADIIRRYEELIRENRVIEHMDPEPEYPRHEREASESDRKHQLEKEGSRIIERGELRWNE